MKMDNTFALIGKIYSGMGTLLVQELKKAEVDGIVSSHGAILMELFFQSELPMNVLAEKIGKTPQTVTSLVKKLVDMGYLETRKSESDCRTTMVLLTDKGRDLQPVFYSISEKLYDTQYMGMTAEEIQELRRLLMMVLENFDQVLDE